jgi:hypothetical protein
LGITRRCQVGVYYEGPGSNQSQDVEARQALAADVKRRVEISSNATKEKKKKTEKSARRGRKKEELSKGWIRNIGGYLDYN